MHWTTNKEVKLYRHDVSDVKFALQVLQVVLSSFEVNYLFNLLIFFNKDTTFALERCLRPPAQWLITQLSRRKKEQNN